MTPSWKFLIFGPGRGGTSLISGLIDNHPQIEVGLDLFSADSLAGWKVDPEIIAKENPHTRMVDRISNFKNKCLAHLRHVKKHYWGNKVTTEHLFGLIKALINGNGHWKDHPKTIETLDYFFGSEFAQQRYIFIIRDGRTCVSSKITRGNVNIEQACENWKFSTYLYQYLQTSPLVKGRTYFIRYEDLVQKPQESLEKICAFLDVTFAPEMLTGTTNEKLLPEYRRNYFDVSRTQVPEYQLWHDHISDELHACGYL